MPCFVFDLDETLANVYTPYYFLYDLQRQATYSHTKPPSKKTSLTPPPRLTPLIKVAYDDFIDKIAEQEKSSDPLGIIRPGILQIMEHLRDMKTKGLCEGVVIYSNNGSLANLHFVRDVIHRAIDSADLICDCIHWHNPVRRSEYTSPIREGAADKTWAVMKKILIKGACKVPSKRVQPNDVYFFDDQSHPDLEEVLGDNYIHMNEYPYKTPFIRVAQIYLDSITKAGLLARPEIAREYITFCAQIYPSTRDYNPMKTLKRHLQIYKQLTGGTSSVGAPSPDLSAEYAEKVVNEIATSPSQNRSYRGGTRRIVKSRSTVHKMTRRNRS
jgi:hypothetical protein